METVLEILKYTLPALVVFFTAYILIRLFIKNEEEKRNMEMNLANQKTILPLRLQAYERIALFLERISPESLIMRVNQTNMTAQELKKELISTIRSEFEHNLSQQVYISSEAWELTKNARAHTINIINAAAEQIKPTANSLTLSKRILEMVVEHTEPPSAKALEYLKREIRQFY